MDTQTSAKRKTKKKSPPRAAKKKTTKKKAKRVPKGTAPKKSATVKPRNDESIIVKAAKVHNLKKIDVEIPRDTLAVITGPSGSGKSSLAFDTIYAEGQRRYVESLSVYARQFLEQLSKPEVESISGLSPTISIEQKTTSYNPRSTVGTVTEVYDYLRLLFARVSMPFCWKCGDPIDSQSPQQITDRILTLEDNTKIAILAPIVQGRKGEYQKELTQLRQRGFVRVMVDGEVRDLSEDIKLDKNKKHNLEVYIDRIIVKGDRKLLGTRLSESVELALKMGNGALILETGGKRELMSEKFACSNCNVNYPEPEPRTFSFNSPAGACPDCDGLGVETEWHEDEEEEYYYEEDSEELSPVDQPCPSCKGTRLRKESLHFFIGDMNISQLSNMSVVRLIDFLNTLKLNKRESMIASRVLKEIVERLEFLVRVGVSYLSLSRSAKTLSGGESQRIRLATQIGSSLVGVIYVLDEPSIGLHPRDHDKLLNTLFQLRDLGNTVLVVEHDRDTMERADWLVDLGPGAGNRGGEVVAQGTLAEIKASPKSTTGQFLTGKREIPVPEKRRRTDLGKSLRIVGAHQNNLKEVDVEFPLGTFICVTGVSGSGKSTLVVDTLYPLLMKHVYDSEIWDVKVKKIEGLEQIDKVIDIDQSPIGRTPRSNPATYTGLFSFIRELFAQLPEAKIRGYKPGRFSFNVKGGRCENCEGGGVRKIEMHFLPDVYVQCEVCRGKRYNRETLEVKFKGKNIAEVLALTAAEALEFFDSVPHIKNKLTILNDVGLGYIHLGQAATSLSGGEAQRIKLTKELSKRGTGKTVYILDEPSTGLHFDDVRRLTEILHRLVSSGNTVIVIEHNLDIIKVADHVIDIGPEGGEAGGQVLVAGSPEKIAQSPKSHTGKFLKPYL